jgi:hypothetical protein
VSQNGPEKAEAQLSDDLIEKARAIASRSDELIDLLEDARQRLLESDPEQEEAKGRGPGPQRRSKPASNSKAEKSENGLSDGLRLLTTQMSAAGANRQEIAERLRKDFAIEDSEQILKKMGL